MGTSGDVLPQFVAACLALALMPGPATALFVHRAVRDGRSAGLAAVAGNEIGLFGWALAAGAGLTALLQANHVLFDALHIVGGTVLVFLGVSTWRSARRQVAGEVDPMPLAPLSSGRTPAAAFRAALVSIAANPKAAVFAFSFFPLFLPASGPVFATTVALAVVQVVVDGTYCAALVLLAVRIRPWLSRRPRRARGRGHRRHRRLRPHHARVVDGGYAQAREVTPLVSETASVRRRWRSSSGASR